MSLILDGTAGITFNNATTQASAGKIIQVVSQQFNGAQGTTSSSSYVATNVTLSITPQFSTSKILVQLNSTAYTSSSNIGYFTLYRGASNLGGANGFAALFTNNSYGVISISCLDAPATTSSTTYTIYFKTASASVGMSDGAFSSAFTLMEIAA